MPKEVTKFKKWFDYKLLTLNIQDEVFSTFYIVISETVRDREMGFREPI